MATPTVPVRTPTLSLWEILRLALSGWEILRLVLSGKEYRDKRIPELVALAITGAQDENAVAGALSDWFRTSFVDENHTALMFAAANVLRMRGGRTFAVIATTLEAMPDIAEEVKRQPTMQVGTPEERQVRLREALADRVTETYEATKARFAPRNPGDSVADTTNPDQPSAWDRFSALFDGVGDSLGGVAEKLAGTAKILLQFVMFWIGISILYLVFALLVAFALPGWMHVFAWMSFAVLVCVPALTMAVGIFAGRFGVVVQGVASFLLAYFSSSLLVIVFALAAICSIVTGEEHFSILCMGVIIVVVWDRVVMGITQKLLGMPGFLAKFMAAIWDREITPAEKEGFAAHWKDNIALVVISITVAGAVNAAWLFITVVSTLQQSVYFPVGIGFIAALVILGGAYVRMGLKLAREGEYARHLGLEAMVKKWSGTLYNGSLVTTVAAPLMALMLIIGYFTLPWEGMVAWLPLRNKPPAAYSAPAQTQESGRSNSTPAPAPQQTPARSNGKMVNCGSSGLKTAEAVAKRKASLGGKPLKGTENNYPWNCDD